MADKKNVQDLIDAEYKRIALRDQFAAAALPACLAQIWAQCQTKKVQVENVYEIAAVAAYEQADAMMAERRKTMFEAAEEQEPNRSDSRGHNTTETSFTQMRGDAVGLLRPPFFIQSRDGKRWHKIERIEKDFFGDVMFMAGDAVLRRVNPSVNITVAQEVA